MFMKFVGSVEVNPNEGEVAGVPRADPERKAAAAREEVEKLPETRVKPMVTIEEMMDRLAKYGSDLGLGAPTGLGLNGEEGGFPPTEEWYRASGLWAGESWVQSVPSKVQVSERTVVPSDPPNTTTRSRCASYTALWPWSAVGSVTVVKLNQRAIGSA